MQADFALEDPATFQQVLPIHELGGGRSRTKKTAATATGGGARNGESGKKRPPSPLPGVAPISFKLLHEKVGISCFICTYNISYILPISQHFNAHTIHNTRQLSHYLDVIEVHLTHQIAERSDLFFSTLSSQQELQTHIMSVHQNAIDLRSPSYSILQYTVYYAHNTTLNMSVEVVTKLHVFVQLRYTHNTASLVRVVIFLLLGVMLLLICGSY